MKKVTTLLTAILLLLCCLGAAAQEAPFEGTWVQFEDGFQVCLPSDWLEMEVSEAMLESGIFYVAASPDGARTVQIAWAETTATTMEEIQAGLATVYPEAAIVENGDGIQFATYEDATSDVAALVALDAEEGGMYMFYFTPASDEDFGDIALAIASSISNT